MAAAPAPLRVLLDTNVVVAALLWSGPPRRLLELSFEGEALQLCSSQVLLDELRHTLGYAPWRLASPSLPPASTNSWRITRRW